MREIPLTRGLVTIVDDEDYESLAPYSWHIVDSGRTLYAGRCYYPHGRRGKRVQVLMHRALCPVEKDMTVDHINGDPLDNRRSNLRSATYVQNGWNRGANKNNKCGLKGASIDGRGRWRAQISISGRNTHIGSFATAQEAHDAYRAASLKLHGEFSTGVQL